MTDPVDQKAVRLGGVNVPVPRLARRHFLAGTAVALALAVFGVRRSLVPEARAQPLAPGPALRQIGEIRSAGGRLQAVLGSANIQRRLPNATETKTLRHFWGRDVLTGAVWPPPNDREAMNPGPTLRARVGDFVEIKFFNQIDVSAFGDDGIDHAETGAQNGCEIFTMVDGFQIYPEGFGDSFPNCFHGSSTTNVHFHGFHVSPDGLGDNVLLKLRPNPRLKEEEVSGFFDGIFERTRRGDPPRNWGDLSPGLTALQEKMLAAYDDAAVWHGEPGALPTANRLLPLLKEQVAAGLWPQFEIGAHPFSFQIPNFADPDATAHHHDAAAAEPFVAGQAPGTHWYHTHVHGSTAINMYHGMAGVFVVEGESYDDKLKALLPGLVEQVMIVQQFAEFPPMIVGSSELPVLTVNGQAHPMIAMRPGEVQLWRLVNGSVDSICKIVGFRADDDMPADTLPEWKQTAQDGIQFDPATYKVQPFSAGGNPLSNFAPGNRIDLLVKAPALASGTLSAAFALDVTREGSGANPLLTLTVSGEPVEMRLPTGANFPPRPGFLDDITDEPRIARKITFSEDGNGPQIDGHHFADGEYDQTMILGDTEDWTLVNTTTTASHPFHIHVNPFQVLEIFDGKTLYEVPTPRPWQDTVAIPLRTDANGYVKIRHRFDDFAGSFVLHCHILEHEDRGMMQLVRVIPKTSVARHH
ncbi:multicopper oxidase domain-containing protein [Mesorhizobium sp. M0220]|uniref:multicopper oxidase domain-containing protein n=1 Tax=Mesorhizobium sp. M0220 TaxID=2956920 RepID=UPI003334F102